MRVTQVEADDDQIEPGVQSAPRLNRGQRRKLNALNRTRRKASVGDDRVDQSPDSDEDSDRFLSGPQVCHRYGGISDMTLWRWLHDERMEFPQPEYFGRLRFWRLSVLEDWERSSATRRAATKNNQPTN
jgi:predicted DNA-binding transcriptional regulator AlpA